MTETFDVGHQNRPYWRFKLIQSRASNKKLIQLQNELKNYFITLGNKNLLEIIKNDKNQLNNLKVIYESIFGRGNALNLTSILLVHYPLYQYARAVCPSKDIIGFFESYIKHRYRIPYHFYDLDFYYAYRIEYKETVSILTGDAMIDANIANSISELDESRKNLVLQVPHHGAKDNWNAVLQNKIDARIYVIQFGYGNKHKHPHSFTIDSLIENNKYFYCVNQKDNYVYYID